MNTFEKYLKKFDANWNSLKHQQKIYSNFFFGSDIMEITFFFVIDILAFFNEKH